MISWSEVRRNPLIQTPSLLPTTSSASDRPGISLCHFGYPVQMEGGCPMFTRRRRAYMGYQILI
jgi:hypothetical protein